MAHFDRIFHIATNEILRTNFIEKQGNVYQKINPIEKVTFATSFVQSNRYEVESRITNYINKEFDLEQDLLVRMELIETSPDTHIVVFCTHHSIMDGWSLEYFIKSFMEIYNSEKGASKKKQKIQFKDYAVWQTNALDINYKGAYWERYLKDYQVKQSFITDQTTKQSLYFGKHLNFELSIKETKKIKHFIQQQKSTMHNVLVSLLNILINKVNNYNDIIIGTVNSGRKSSELSTMIGMLVKTLPLRTKITEDQTLLDVLRTVQADMIKMDDFQDIPDIYRRKTLFDVLITYQNPGFSYKEEIKIGEAILQSYPINIRYSRIPLLFSFYEINEQLQGNIFYDSELYDEATVQLIMLRYKKLINTSIKTPAAIIKELDISLDFEQEEIIAIDFNF